MKTATKAYYVEVREMVSKVLLVRTDQEPTEENIREILEHGSYEEQEESHERFEEIVYIEEDEE